MQRTVFTVQRYERTVPLKAVTAYEVLWFFRLVLSFKPISNMPSLKLVTLITCPQSRFLTSIGTLLLQLCDSTQQPQLLLFRVKHLVKKVSKLTAQIKNCRPDFLLISQGEQAFAHFARCFSASKRTTQHVQHFITPLHVVWHNERSTVGVAV